MLQTIATRRLAQDEPVPFGLLLLADEELEAIERYIRQSEIYVVEISGVCVAVTAPHAQTWQRPTTACRGSATTSGTASDRRGPTR